MNASWQIATTVKASPDAIYRFVAHHISAGASAIDVYLDDPADDRLSELRSHPAVRYIECDESYWLSERRDRPSSHVERQIHNASRSYRGARCNWLAHIDVDEFLFTDQELSRILADVPESTSALRIRPVELLHGQATLDGLKVSYFKRPVRGKALATGVLNDVYPTFGKYLKTGLISHRQGKAIARTGQDVRRFGIHRFRPKSGVLEHPTLDDVSLAHYHTDGFDDFLRQLERRLDTGSYRADTDQNNLLRSMMEGPDLDLLRAFFSEVCSASHATIARLEKHDLIEIWYVDFDAQTQNVFGDVG